MTASFNLLLFLIIQLLLSINGQVALINSLPDTAFNASSFWNSSYEPHLSKFSSSSGWGAGTENQNEWLLIDLGTDYVITSVSTKGCGALDEWVTTYTINYAAANDPFSVYPETFQGNTDKNTPTKNILIPPVILRYVRFHPETWKTWPTMRVEAFGYIGTLPPTKHPTTTPTRPTLNPTPRPTPSPTHSPSHNPSKSHSPSHNPTTYPSINPTNIPTRNPSMSPSQQPSQYPTTPTINPSLYPSINPTITPTKNPSNIPTKQPSFTPTKSPTPTPTLKVIPTVKPTGAPLQLHTTTQTHVDTTEMSAARNNDLVLNYWMFVVISIVAAVICVFIIGLIWYRNRKLHIESAKTQSFLDDIGPGQTDIRNIVLENVDSEQNVNVEPIQVEQFQHNEHIKVKKKSQIRCGELTPADLNLTVVPNMTVPKHEDDEEDDLSIIEDIDNITKGGPNQIEEMIDADVAFGTRMSNDAFAQDVLMDDIVQEMDATPGNMESNLQNKCDENVEK